MEAIRFSETLTVTRSPWRHISGNIILLKLVISRIEVLREKLIVEYETVAS
jgi:hypothetical protein